MKVAVSITHMDGVLYATCTGGKCTVQEILYHTQNVVNAAKRHQCDRILIVVNDVEAYNASFNHLWSLANIFGTLPEGTRVAFNRQDAEYHLGSKPSAITLRHAFLTGAARTYGIQVRAFEAIHDAREWLGLTMVNVAREKQPRTAPALQRSALKQARERRKALIAQANRTP
jgi:hypothetical protein